MPKMPAIKTTEPTEADQKLHKAIAALIKEHLTPDTSERVLAIAAQVVGQVIAMQDQRTMTPDKAMEIVIANIESGNRHAMQELLGTPKGSA